MRIHIGVLSVVLFLGLFSVDTVLTASPQDTSIGNSPAKNDPRGKTSLSPSAGFQINEAGGASVAGGEQEIVVILGTTVLLLALIILRLRTSSYRAPGMPEQSDPLLQTRPGHDEAPAREVEESPPQDEEVESETALYGRLYVLRGLEEDEIPIHCEEFTIGRVSGGECDYGIDRPYVSPRHCSVSYRAGEFIIKDLGSKNGTYVNGERLPREREVIVPVGSEIEITKNIVFELWDRDTIVNVDREVVASEQEFSTHGEGELVFQPMPGIAYADDRDGAINDGYSPI